MVNGICTGHRFLFGGAGLGAAISALEGTTGRPVVWATAQYLNYAKAGSVLDIDVVVAVEGRSMTQARATGHVGGTEILTVNAALGERDFAADAVWAEMPDVPGPQDSPERHYNSDITDSISQRLDVRVAAAPGGGDFSAPADLGPGRVAVWVRIGDLLEPSSASLAVLGDYVPMGIGLCLQQPAMSNSLDNTMRVQHPIATEWYLIDIAIDGVHNGVGHGTEHIWSADGSLLATASQSAVVRSRPGDKFPPPPRLSKAP